MNSICLPINRQKLTYSLILLFFTLSLYPLTASAGLRGCSRTPQPGDYLDCSLNGPFGPSGENYVECRDECNAYEACLNTPPAAGCSNERDALEQCAPGAHDDAYPNHANGLLAPPVGTVSYSSDLGCFLIPASTINSAPSGDRDHFQKSPGASNRMTVESHGGNFEEACAVSIDQGNYILDQAQTMVGQALAYQLGGNEAPYSADLDLYDDLDASWEDVRAIADSMGLNFSVDVEDNVVDNMHTVGDLIDCIANVAVS